MCPRKWSVQEFEKKKIKGNVENCSTRMPRMNAMATNVSVYEHRLCISRKLTKIWMCDNISTFDSLHDPYPKWWCDVESEFICC